MFECQLELPNSAHPHIESNCLMDIHIRKVYCYSEPDLDDMFLYKSN